MSGRWRTEIPGPAIVTFTRGPVGYHLTGTDGRYRHEGVVGGDGLRFEGALKDVPGFCCGREGYVWMEAIDGDRYRARSVWWTPGRGNRDKSELTCGWSTWKRDAGELGPSPARPAIPSKSTADKELAARKKVISAEVNRVRIERRWSPDHHYQVGTLLGNAKTLTGVDAIEVLMRDHAACYARKNSETDRIQEAARAGQYPTPDQRVGALNQASAVFDRCIETAIATWRGAPR